MLYYTITTAALLASLPAVLAQTSTTCNPLSASCPSDAGLTSSSLTSDFTTKDFSQWTYLSGGSLASGSNGAQFTITADGQSPTLQSNFYIFFGRVDVVMQAAPGVGIVSSVVLESDDLDEIDWEFLGGDATQGQTNFFGKGDISSYSRGGFSPVSSPQTTFHTYSIDWTAERIQWLIDNQVVRTLAYGDALAKGGAEYPQTPMRVKLGSWVAGGANNAPGTVQWAGGKTDFSQAPFNMYVKSVKVTNNNPAASYSYGDMSGSWQSIKLSGAGAVSSPVSSVAAVSSATSQAPPASTVTSQADKVPVTSSTTTIATTTTAALVSTQSPVTSVTTVTTSASKAVSSLPASSGFVSQSRVSSSSASPTSTEPARQTANGAASLSISAAGSLFGLAAAFALF